MSIYRRNQNTINRPPKGINKHERMLLARKDRIDGDKLDREDIARFIARIIRESRWW